MPQTLLLADDSVTIQRVIELTFADEDIDVVAVSDGDQAIARLDAAPPDILLVDVGMPGKSGYEVAAYVKQTPKLAHIPVVLLTGAFEPWMRSGPPRLDATACWPSRLSRRWSSSVSRTCWAGPRGQPGGRATSSRQRLPRPPCGLDRRPRCRSMSRAPIQEDRRLLRSARRGVHEPDRQAGLRRDVGRCCGAGRGRLVRAQTGVRAGRHARRVAVAGRAAAVLGARRRRPGDSAAGGIAAAPVCAGAPSCRGTRHLLRHSRRRRHRPPSAPPPLPPLADAFAALLEAEQSEPEPGVRPAWPSAARSAPVVTDDLVEQVTRRVLEQLTDRVVRDAVAERVSAIAERLVREEIERIKASIK